MSRFVDVVIRGKIYDYTHHVIDQYSHLPHINKIILSTWIGEDVSRIPRSVEIVESEPLQDIGIGSRNAQIKASHEGLKRCESSYTLLVRTDHLYGEGPIKFLINFAIAHNIYDAADEPQRICVLGIHKKYPFHVRDHLFFGRRRDLQLLFSMPYDSVPFEPEYSDIYDKFIRTETYIGANWYRQRDFGYFEDIDHYLANPQEYLVDAAPNKGDALTLFDRVQDRAFCVFPKVPLSSPRHKMREYDYVANKIAHWEYTHEDLIIEKIGLIL